MQVIAIVCQTLREVRTSIRGALQKRLELEESIAINIAFRTSLEQMKQTEIITIHRVKEVSLSQGER